MLCFLYMQDEKKMSFKLFSKQFPSEIHSYRPPLPIQYLGFPFYICIVNVELAQAATVFDVLCVRLQRLWLLLMAVYRLGNISTQMKIWKMISMQFVQVRSQNRSVPSRGGRSGKNIIQFLFFRHFMILSQFFVMLFYQFVWAVLPD